MPPLQPPTPTSGFRSLNKQEALAATKFKADNEYMKPQYILYKTGLRLMMVFLSFFILTGCDGRTPKPSTSQIKEMAQNFKVGSLIFSVSRSNSTDNFGSSPSYDVFVVSKVEGDDVLLAFLAKAKVYQQDVYDEKGHKVVAQKKAGGMYFKITQEEYEMLKKNPEQANIFPVYVRDEEVGTLEYLEPLIANSAKPVFFYYAMDDGGSFMIHYSKSQILEKGVLNRCIEGKPIPDGLDCSDSHYYIEKIVVR